MKFLIFLALLFVTGFSLASGININSCQTLSSADTYTLTQDVSQGGACFNITASQVALDCNGFKIIYGTSDNQLSNAVNITASNSNVSHCIMELGGNRSSSVYAIHTSEGSGYIVNNTLIYNNTIITRANTTTSSFSSVRFSGYNWSIINNTINTSSDAITLIDGSSLSLIGNTIFGAGGTARTSLVNIADNALNTNIINNTLITDVNSNTMIFYSPSNNAKKAVNNTIMNNRGIDRSIGTPFLTLTSINSTISNNTIVVNTTAISLVNTNNVNSSGNIFLNNNITFDSSFKSSRIIISDTSGDDYINYLIYNNSFGEIRWNDNGSGSFLRHLNITVTSGGLSLGDNLFISNNTLALNTSAFTGKINSSANITFYGLGHYKVNSIKKVGNFTLEEQDIIDKGTDCNGTSCQTISFSNKDLLFNVTSLSSYSAHECGNISGSNTLTRDVNSSGTCFTVAANDVTLNCNGYTTHFGTSGSGYGLDNQNGYDNITITHCIIKKASSSGLANYGIFYSNSQNGTILNNSIVTNSTGQNYGIYIFSASNSNNISNNTITTDGSSSDNIGIRVTSSTNNILSRNIIFTNGTIDNYGIHLLSSSNNNNISNNTITTDGSSSGNIGIRLASSTNNILDGNVISTNGTGLNYGIYLLSSSNNNNISSNTFSTDGTSSTNYGVSIDSSTRNILNKNTISTDGTSSNYGINIGSSSNNNNISNNTITTDGSSINNYGVIVTSSTNNILSRNIIFTNGTSSNFGFYLDDVNDSNFESNNISVGNSYGIYLVTSESSNNLFLNNNISSNTSEFFDSIGTAINTLIYNNSFGQINWTLTNLTFNITNDAGFGLGRNLNIINNTLAVNTSALTGQLNSSAHISFYGIALTNVYDIFRVSNYTENRQDILDNGQDCLENNCTFISFTGRNLLFNLTRFSSYTAQEDLSNPSISFIPLTTNSSNLSQSFIQVNVSFSDSNNDTLNVTVYDTSRNKYVSSNSTLGTFFFVNFTGIVDGNYTFNATINDTAGNTNFTETRTVMLDTTPPNITFIRNTTNSSNTTNTFIEATINFTDQIARIGQANITLWDFNKNKINSTSSSTSILEFNFTGLSDGNYSLNATVNDTVGNTNLTEVRYINIDTTSPNITFIDVTTNTSSTTSTTIEVNVTASDQITKLSMINITLWNSTFGKLFSNDTSGDSLNIIYTSLSIDTYYLNATANDTMGNLNFTETRTITITAVQGGGGGGSDILDNGNGRDAEVDDEVEVVNDTFTLEDLIRCISDPAITCPPIGDILNLLLNAGQAGGGGDSPTITVQEVVTVGAPGTLCGNNMCEEGENPLNCRSDCQTDLDVLFTCAFDKDIKCPSFIPLFLLGGLLIILVLALYLQQDKKKKGKVFKPNG